MAKLYATKRGRAAIAAIVAASIGGSVAMFKGEPPIPDDVALAMQSLTKPWEGNSLRAYPDPATGGKPWTICDGDTENVRPGMVETPEGCQKRTTRQMLRKRAELSTCIVGFANKPLAWRAMMNDLAYNIGTGATCRSTAAAMGRAGRYLDSCFAATAFNKANNRFMIGLAKRREMGDATRIGEGELCVSGLGL